MNESRAVVGDKVAVSKWESTKQLLLKPIGFGEQYLGVSDSDDDKNIQLLKPQEYFPLLNNDRNIIIDNFLNEIYSTKNKSDTFFIYKTTIALSEFFLRPDSPFDGLTYPAFCTDIPTYNDSLKPNTVDSKLKFIDVIYFEVIEKKDDLFTVRLIDVSNSIDKNGLIVWGSCIFDSKSVLVKVIQ